MKRRLWHIFLTLGVIYLAAAVFAVPYLIRTKAPEIVRETTGGTLEIGKVLFNPFIFDLEMEDIRFSDPQGQPLMTLRRLDVNLDIVHLLAGSLSVEYFGLYGLKLHIVQERDGRFNFDWLTHLGGTETAAPPPSDENATRWMPSLRLETLELEDGGLYFTDRSRPSPLQLAFEPVGLTLHDLDTAGGGRNRIHFYARTVGGGVLDVRSSVKAFSPPAVSGTVDYDAARLYDAWHFLQEVSALEVADGQLHLHFAYDVNLSDLNRTVIDDLQFALTRLRIKPKAAHSDVLRLTSLSARGGPIRPMQHSARIASVELEGLYAAAKRRADGGIDWAGFFPQTETRGTAPAAEANATAAAPWDVLIARAALRGVRARFDDRNVTPPVRFTLNDFNVSALQVSSLPATPFAYRAALRFNGALRCKSEGNVSHSPLDVSAVAACRGLDLTWFNPYIEAAADAALARHDIVLRSGRLGAAVSARLHESNGTVNVTVGDGNVTLDALQLTPRDSDRTLAGLQSLSLGGVTVSTAERKAGAKTLLLAEPLIQVRRLKDGSIDAAQLIAARPAAPARPAEAAAQPETAPWSAGIDTVGVRDGRAVFSDAALPETTTTTVRRFNLEMNGVTTDPSRPIGATARFGIGGGSVRVGGTVVRQPLDVKADYALRGVRLKPFSPYVEATSYARLDGGSVYLSGHARYRPSKRSPDLRVRGDFRLEDLLLSDTRDAAPLLFIRQLEAKPFFFDLAPGRLFVDTMNLDGFYSTIEIDANKTLNLSTLMRPSGAPAEPPAASPSAQKDDSGFPVRILRLDIGNGAVHFADASLPLPFDTQIHDVNGEMFGISTLRGETTYMRLDGEVDRYGVARAEGSLNAGDPKAYTDIGVQFRNIDLKSYTPYSGKFVGRAIDAGKLSVTLRYQITDAKMKGDNGLVINNIRLGGDIKSKDAVSLPLGLAIALLEDSDGVIDLDMPVRGDVNNPDFRWGGVVWKAFVNLVTKAVTAPFALLGAALGIEGDALKTVPFEAGSAIPDAVARERLDLLAKALLKRPKLGLVVRGAYDASEDARALKRRALVEEVLAAHAEEELTPRDALAPALLEPLYEKRLGGAALDALKKEVKAMETDAEGKARRYGARLIDAMVETQPLPADALTLLAGKRARMVRDYLADAKGVDVRRIRAESPEAVRSEKGFVPMRVGLDALK